MPYPIGSKIKNPVSLVQTILIEALHLHSLFGRSTVGYSDNMSVSFFLTERGRRFAVSVGGPQTVMDVGDLTELPTRRPASPEKEEEESGNEEKVDNSKADEEDRDKGNDADDDESDEADNEEAPVQNDEEEDEDDEPENETQAAPEEVPVPKIVEPSLGQESQADTESEHDSDRDSDGESESDMTEVVKQESEESPTRIHTESSPPSDSETDVSLLTKLEAGKTKLENEPISYLMFCYNFTNFHEIEAGIQLKQKTSSMLVLLEK